MEEYRILLKTKNTFKAKNVCPEVAFTDIDKLLHQLDLEKGNKVKY